MDEITPGIARLVAHLQKRGFNTVDSGDGVTNVELRMSCAVADPSIFIEVPKERAVAEADRLWDVVWNLGVNFTDEDSRETAIGCSYDARFKKVTVYLFGVDDEMIWGPDPDLPRKRLEYQIRYCDQWLADPPVEKMDAADIEQGKADYAALREEFVAKLANLGG